LGTGKHQLLESAKPSGELMLRAASGQHRPDGKNTDLQTKTSGKKMEEM
jgi:hypothetical protein